MKLTAILDGAAFAFATVSAKSPFSTSTLLFASPSAGSLALPLSSPLRTKPSSTATTTYTKVASLTTKLLLASVVSAVGLAFLSPAAHAAYKCQSPEGRVEYSDRPCESSKTTLDTPQKNANVTSRPLVRPMEQLNKLLAEFEPAMCERERLAIEVDRANRAGNLRSNAEEWKSKEARLMELNDLRITFQIRARKIIDLAGRDSPESIALQKFNLTLKNCDREPTQSAQRSASTNRSAAHVETKSNPNTQIIATKGLATSAAPPSPK